MESATLSRLDAPSASEEPPVSVSVVVPVVARCDDLLEIYRAFSAQLEREGLSYEFLFVLDGGAPPLPDELLRRARTDGRLRFLAFSQALGEQVAIGAGFERSRGEVLVTLPPYFQVQPEGLRAALAEFRAGADLVVARRSPRVDSWINRLQSRVFHSLVRAGADVTFRDMSCGLRVMRREVADRLLVYGSLYRFFPAVAAHEGYRVAEVPVGQHPSDTGRRIRRPGVYLASLLDIVTFLFLTKFTDRPLRFFGQVGAGLLLVGFALGTVLVFERLVLERGIADRPLLLLAVLLVTVGVQVIGLGLVGEIIVNLASRERRIYRARKVV